MLSGKIIKTWPPLFSREFFFRQRPFLLLGSGLLLLGLGFLHGRPRQANQLIFIFPQPSLGTINVTVKGAIYHPGRYQLKNGAVFADLLSASGGLRPQAARNWIKTHLSLDFPLHQGEIVFVPYQKSQPANYPLNLNRASRQALAQLPGLGPRRAQLIINYRQQHGGFHSLAELQAIKGIGPRLFQQLKVYLYLSEQK